MPNIDAFPEYFRAYNWKKKHYIYGYPEDRYPEFSWITSLEKRFSWVAQNYRDTNTASRYLIQEMIQWGGSQGGVLQKFDDGIGEVNLYNLLDTIIQNIGTPSLAISSALNIPGMGLTYASKLLRFIDPENYGALDSRVKGALNNRVPGAIPVIHDGNSNSMIRGYIEFVRYITNLRNELDLSVIMRPQCAFPSGLNRSGWRSADIEMALFSWAESNDP